MDVFVTRYKSNIICETSYDPKLNMVMAVWRGYTDAESVQEWGETYLKLMKKYHCPYLHNDDRKSVGPWHQSIEWLENYLVPNLMKEGLQYYAHIVSENVFGSISADKLESKISSTLTMKMFRTPEEGKKWLTEKMKANEKKSH